MLTQLAYVSVRKTSCTEEDINNILSACLRNNGALDITGVLLYSDTHFFQYIEGPKEQLYALYDKIKLDPRHTNAMTVYSGDIAQRAFPSWQMGCKQLDENSVEFRTRLDPGERRTFQKLLSGDHAEGNRALTFMKKLFGETAAAQPELA